jgi:hypothetical protein
MKVQDITSTSIDLPSKDSKRIGKSAQDFGQLFQEELAQVSDAPEGLSASCVPSRVLSLDHLTFASIPDKAPGDVLQAATDVDSAIEQMESLEQLLANTAVSPKQVDQAISSLASTADLLQQKVASLPAEHPLRQIGNELAVVAHVESVKWRRGDYI